MAEITYTYRALNEKDMARIQEWVQSDPEHQTVDPKFFCEPRTGVSHFCVEDKDGPVFYATIENVARVHIQFNPHGSKLKNVKALKQGLSWLLQSLRPRGYHELIFDSVYRPLVRFAQSVLGFLPTTNDLKTRL